MGTYYKDGYYKGQENSCGEPHGYGEFEFKNGAVYKGNWDNGKMHGYGTLIKADGSKYTGFFRNNNYDGLGVIKFPDGMYFDGSWKDGKKHGHGKIRYTDGTVITGEWRDDEFVKKESETHIAKKYTSSNYENPSKSTVKTQPKLSPEANRRRLADIKEKRKTVVPLCLLGMISAVALDYIMVSNFKDASIWWRILLLPLISLILLGGMTVILGSKSDKGYFSSSGTLSWIWRITGIIWGIARLKLIVEAHFATSGGWGTFVAVLTSLFAIAFNVAAPCIMTFIKWDD